MDLQALETHSDTIAKVAVPLALVCWLAYLSVEQFYFFADNEQLISDLETSQPARATNNPAPPIKLSQAALNLFGESGKAPVKEVVAAPETRLNLELQGVFTNNNPDLSSAIIAERGKNGELFAIGDRVPGNALLHAVEQDHVLIKRGSRLEKLLFRSNDSTSRVPIRETDSLVTQPRRGLRREQPDRPAKRPHHQAAAKQLLLLLLLRAKATATKCYVIQNRPLEISALSRLRRAEPAAIAWELTLATQPSPALVSNLVMWSFR